MMVDAVDRTGYCSIGSDGIVGEDFTVSSRDGCVVISLSEGTQALDAEGDRLSYIDVMPVEPLPEPPEGHFVLAAFEFKPDGATFVQAMGATLCFDPADIPEGMSPDNIVIAVLDAETGEWSFIGGTVDTDSNTITFDIDHFSVYGVLAAPAAPTATPTTTTEDKQFSGTDMVPAAGAGGGIGMGVWIGIIVAVVILLAIAAGLWIMKRRGLEFSDLRDGAADLWDTTKDKLKLER